MTDRDMARIQMTCELAREDVSGPYLSERVFENCMVANGAIRDTSNDDSPRSGWLTPDR